MDKASAEALSEKANHHAPKGWTYCVGYNSSLAQNYVYRRKGRTTVVSWFVDGKISEAEKAFQEQFK